MAGGVYGKAPPLEYAVTTDKGHLQIRPGYQVPEVQPEEPCMEGHNGFWGYRRRGRMIDWACCFRQNNRWCWAKRTEGFQGFMAKGKPAAAPFVIRNWVISALFGCGPGGGTIADIRPRCPSLTTGQIHGGLNWLSRAKEPYVIKSVERVALVVAGSEYLYQLSWRGLAYFRLLAPDVRGSTYGWEDKP
jgi:hypothetical protein